MIMIMKPIPYDYSVDVLHGLSRDASCIKSHVRLLRLLW